MSDTYTLHFQNFRSLRDTSIELAPLTVIYGPNGSGKSSVIYGLLTLKNFLANPNQNMVSLFSYPSISLGGLQEVAHRHLEDRSLSLSIGVSNPGELSSRFMLTMDQSGGAAKVIFGVPEQGEIQRWPLSLDTEISLPYRSNQRVSDTISIRDSSCQDAPGLPIFTGTVDWNGITVSAQLDQDAAGHADVLRRVNERANLPMELARLTGFVPLRRGFSKTTYGFSGVTPTLGTEDEVASLLTSPDHRFRQYDISKYLEQIAGRRVQTQTQIGTSTFTIDSIPTGQGIPVSIVNEGFGINQLLYMLTVCLYPPFRIVAIEEPEIHLHPSMVRNLALAMSEIATTEERRLIVSTHSEAFVVALLSQIAAGKVSVDDVSFILAENPNVETKLTPCPATPDGQIEGGLQPFMASEVEDLMNFLSLGN